MQRDADGSHQYAESVIRMTPSSDRLWLSDEFHCEALAVKMSWSGMETWCENLISHPVSNSLLFHINFISSSCMVFPLGKTTSGVAFTIRFLWFLLIRLMFSKVNSDSPWKLESFTLHTWGDCFCCSKPGEVHLCNGMFHTRDDVKCFAEKRKNCSVKMLNHY